ncbi:glycosyltransferase family 2 protein [Roseibium sp.]|uniref:glycosyltransferase family 2 protein n=1 Tax=Roseibium sp. TaxID=1936156 RepID=UPI003A98590A
MTDTQLRIGIMICTAKRPKMLENCLKSLARQDIEPGWVVEICVVENDDDLHSREAISRSAAECPFPIHHVLETCRGIPFARNRTLREAMDRKYDWIALIDDDEVALDGWLKAHMHAVECYEADVSYGDIRQEYEQEPPKWWTSAPSIPAAIGTELRRASTGNVMFCRDILDAPALLRFDERLLYGYEDLDFFERAHGMGYKIVSAPDAVIIEDVPASRMEPSRLLNWCRASAASHTQVAIIRRGRRRAAVKFGLKALRRILGGALGSGIAFVPAKLGSQTAVHAFYKFRMRMARGIGNMQGLINTPYHYYEKIDGR